MNTHANEARKHIDWTHEWQGEGDTPEANIANAHLAVALATLELAEQQRIANLIALADFGHPIPRSSASEPAREALTVYREHRYPGNDGWVELRPEIAAALGIEQDS